MNKYTFIFIIVSALAEGTTEYLPRGMKLKFYFPAENEVEFEYWIPMEIIEPYEWVGLAFQDIKYARNNFKADYYMATKSEGVFSDYYLDHEGDPVLDTDLGGTNDILESFSVISGNYMIFVLRRELKTEDEFDTELVMDRPFMVKWAMGVMGDGRFVRHDMLDLGFEYLVLTEGYEDRNHDEYQVYGPYLDYPPEYENTPPPERKPENFEWSIMIENYYMGVVIDANDFYVSDDSDEPEIEYNIDS